MGNGVGIGEPQRSLKNSSAPQSAGESISAGCDQLGAVGEVAAREPSGIDPQPRACVVCGRPTPSPYRWLCLECINTEDAETLTAAVRQVIGLDQPPAVDESDRHRVEWWWWCMALAGLAIGAIVIGKLATEGSL